MVIPTAGEIPASGVISSPMAPVVSAASLAAARAAMGPWEDIVGGVNVDSLGAVGDGTHDDTAIIQSAVNSFSCVIFTGSKTYVITDLIHIPKGRTIIGNGAKIKPNFSVSNKDAILISGEDKSDITIDSLSVISGSGAFPHRFGIQVYGVGATIKPSNIRLVNCNTSGHSQGLGNSVMSGSI